MKINRCYTVAYTLAAYFVWVAPLFATGDPPTISLADNTIAYTEDQFSYPQLDPAVTVNDPDNDWDGGSIAVQITANAEATDRIKIQDFGSSDIEITFENSFDVMADGVKVGDSDKIDGEAYGSDVLNITLNSNATNAIVLALLQQLRFFVNTSDPGSATRTVTVSIEDGDFDTADDSRQVSVTPRNDNPYVNYTPTDPDFSTGDPAVQLFTGVSASTVEAGQKLIAMEIFVTNVYDGAEEKIILEGTPLSLEDGVTDGNISVSVTGRDATIRMAPIDADAATIANIVENLLTYQHTGSNPTGAERAISVNFLQDDGGTANNGDDTYEFTFPCLVNVAGDPPSTPSLRRKAIRGEVTDGTSKKQGVIVYIPKLGAAVTNAFGVYTIPGAEQGKQYTAYFQTDDLIFTDDDQGVDVHTAQFLTSEGTFQHYNGYGCPEFDGRTRFTTIVDRASEMFRLSRRKARRLKGSLKKRSLKAINDDFDAYITANRAIFISPLECADESYATYYCTELDLVTTKADLIAALVDLRKTALLIIKRLQKSEGWSDSDITRAKRNIRKKFKEAKAAIEEFPDAGWDCGGVA